MPVRGGAGLLGEYVRDKHKEPNGRSSSASLTVDLTESEFQILALPFPCLADHDSIGNDEDTPTVQDPKDEEVCYGMIKSNLNCSRVPSPKPGSLSVFGENYNPAIKVVLKRIAGEKTNMIQAYDHTRDIIGVVEAATAGALAPLIDSNVRVRTDCRIPAQPKKAGDEPGQPTSRAYQMDIVIYGLSRYTKSVGGWLNRHNVRLVAPYLVQKGIRVSNPHVTEWRPPPAKVYPTDANGTLVSSSTRTVEEMKSEIMGVFDSLARTENLPMADPSPIITTPLLKHQKQGLFFMLAKEELRESSPDDKSLVSFWQTKVTPNHEKRYYNVITRQTQKEPPPETRGGLLADMMGLGKTLSILSLIASTGPAALQWGNSEPIQPTAPETRTASRHDGLFNQSTLNLTPLVRNVKATLLVCPLSTVSNWEEQIKQHMMPDTFSYHIYHGSNRIKDPEKLAAFDLVITTYGSVSNELSSRNKGKDGLYPLEQIGWFRVVLDEAHMIREPATLQFKSIIRLQADRRWAVTGTPVQNRLEDFASLLAFLRLHPFDHRSNFTRHIVEPFKLCDSEVVPKLRVLVGAITLRRLKDKIDLPPREDLLVKLDFSSEELSVYKMFERNAKDRVSVLAGVQSARALRGNTYIHILKTILRLRLLCAHGKDLLNEDDLASLQGMTADMAIDVDDDGDDRPELSDKKAHEMLTLLQETNNDGCVQCGKKLGSNEGSNIENEAQDDVLGYMTPCFHVVCRSCIQGYQEKARLLLDPSQKRGICPMCNSSVAYEFVQLHQQEVEAEHAGPAKAQARGSKKSLTNYQGPHTKTQALVEDLLKTKAISEANPSEPPHKSVVFSGWTSHLDLIELALDAAGIKFTRLDGSMTRTARSAAMDAFRTDDNIHVILVSIMAGGLGLNLTAGNNVYVMEPQYNPAAEAQAVDRVHRLGQKRPVRTVRYIMRDSFEESMLVLQDKKKKLANLSMDSQTKSLDKPKTMEDKLRELQSLFK
jgi:SNF2 family DNA or RNA helicase